ncbi:MAG: flagellar hook-basal body complex protein FliE [Desulfitobacteriaceae bacterium]
MSINGITPLQALSPLSPLGKVDSLDNAVLSGTEQGSGLAKAGGDFAKFLNDALQQVDTLQKNADAAGVALAAGQTQDLHTVMIAMEKASLSLSMTVQVRNKVLDAYHEIMRMQI